MWMGRDVSGESGGFHLYACAQNDHLNRTDALGLKSLTCIDAAQLFTDRLREFGGERYNLMVARGCSVVVTCGCCDADAQHRFSRRARTSFIRLCDKNRSNPREIWASWFAHEFSHAFDFCTANELPSNPCEVGDAGWSFKICSEIRAYSARASSGTREDIARLACGSVSRGCNMGNPNDPYSAVMDDCMRRARQLYVTCTSLGETDPLPPAFPPSPPAVPITPRP
jgi:hypothetical protein